MPSLVEMLTGKQQQQPTGAAVQALTQPPFDEDAFQTGIRDTEWFAEFAKQYGEEPDIRPMSDNPALGPDYDYRKAWASGMRPTLNPNDNKYHWGSSLDNGEMLKSENHPTAWKEYFMRKYQVDPDTLSEDQLMSLGGGIYNGR